MNRTSSAARSTRRALDVVATVESSLHVKKVSKTFGEGPLVLSDISIDVPFGQVLALLGPTGCGKSTFLEIVCGLQAPDSGGGIHLGDAQVTGRRGLFAYMPQRDALLPWRTALNNATLGLTARGWDRRQARHHALELFETFHLAAYADYLPRDLSGGMRQRVALLRTFLFPSKYMLLDEPFSALDAITRSNVHVWLAEALAEFPRTVLLVTHDIEEAILLADRVIVLGAHPGCVAADVEVPIPSPRDLEVESLPAFHAVRHQILEVLARYVPGLLRSLASSAAEAQDQRATR